MSDGAANEYPTSPTVSVYTGPVAELIHQRMLSPPPQPGVLAMLDHFEILRILGGGGMGVVLLARDTRTGREVAIKLVRSDLVTNQQIIHRFLKEAGHLKRLQHANIVPVADISDRAEGPYFVMPYYEKGSLANRLKSGQPLDTQAILDIAIPVAEGLAFAHRSGIIHRDLKPANILLGANDQACLGDFGLARSLFNDTIMDVGSRHIEGTVPYMSPGVAAGDAEDTRCDIYSFGALLYEMLTGRPPYQGRKTQEILDQILAGPPKPISSLNPAADRRLVAVADRALARELRDRYAEMRDVLNDLQRIKSGKSPAGQGKAATAGPVPIIASTLAGILVVALFSWMLWPKNSAPVKPPQPAVTASSVTPSARHGDSPSPANPPVVNPPVVTNPPVASPPDSKITAWAGQIGAGGYADGTGAEARFFLPNNVAVDHAGNVYVADTGNSVIRKITKAGDVSTLAGHAGSHGHINGIGDNARFLGPFGIAVDDRSGHVYLYVADTGNNVIRKVTPDGAVTTLAGSAGHPGWADGLRDQARFRNPWGVAVDGSGNVLVADLSNDTIRKITPEGLVSTLAGQAGVSGDTDGSGTNALFYHPFAVAVDRAGSVYVSDSANNAIRKLTLSGTVIMVSTPFGLKGYAGNQDGKGDNARFSNPQGLAVDAAGNIYVADTGNHLVRRISFSTGMVDTLSHLAGAGNAADKSAGDWQLKSPGGVAVDDAGNLYVADTGNHCVRKLGR